MLISLWWKRCGHDHRGKAQRRLIQHEEFRSGHQCPTDGKHLLLAPGKGPGLLGAPFPETGEDVVYPAQSFWRSFRAAGR